MCLPLTNIAQAWYPTLECEKDLWSQGWIFSNTLVFPPHNWKTPETPWTVPVKAISDPLVVMSISIFKKEVENFLKKTEASTKLN